MWDSSTSTAHRPMPRRTVVPGDDRLLGDLRALIEASRQQVARAVNSAMVLTYWAVGDRIGREILGDERAEYGRQIVERLAGRLSSEYGAGFSRSNLFAMVRLAELFPDLRIVQTLSGQLSWSHFIALIHLPDPLQRDFYAQMCALERWSVRTLRQRIRGLLFERTAIARRPEAVAAQETELPPRAVLEATLHTAIRIARERLATTGRDPGAEE